MAIKKRPVSPRQKMINLMYVVLMAMLALNVSSEVLESFTLVEESIRRTATNTARQNGYVYGSLEEMMAVNPVKAGKWYKKAQEVRNSSDSLYNYISDLKKEIALECGMVKQSAEISLGILKNREDLEAASQVMLAPNTGKGKDLYNAISAYRQKMIGYVNDPIRKNVIADCLTTEVEANGKSWQEYMFESMPAAAAITMLSKIQADIRYAEGEVVNSLAENIDKEDIRVNSLSAFVIPESKTVIRGNKLSARIVMAAVDTTQIPELYINSEKTAINNSIYETVCNKTGNFTLKGWLQISDSRGDILKREFSQDYTVIEPMGVASAELMNVLYAGYDNPISVSVPGVPLSEVTATMDGGTLTNSGAGKYIARPSKVGHDCKVNIYARHAGRQQLMGQKTFKVRRLPEPTPYIAISDEKGNSDRFKGGAVAKSTLLNSGGLRAAVDDGILDVPFRVVSFETVMFDNMGNAVPVPSDGADFSTRQKETIRRVRHNGRFYVSRIVAVGPDGTQRRLTNSMEIIVR
mgnify:CR=1 FL=1